MTKPMADDRLAWIGEWIEKVTPQEAHYGTMRRFMRELLAEATRARTIEAELRVEVESTHEHAQTVHDQTAELGGHVMQLRTGLAEARDALTVAAELLDRLAEDTGCDYDHHDNCRTHSLQKRPCPHPLGRQFVEAWRAVDAEQRRAADDGQRPD